jgi:hypothetical protein
VEAALVAPAIVFAIGGFVHVRLGLEGTGD